MPRKRIHHNQSLGLPLTAEERNLILNELLILDDAYESRIRGAAPNKPEIPFTLDELDDLAGHVAASASHCTRKKQKALDIVYEKIQHVLNTHTDDAAEASTGAVKAATADGIDPKELDPLRLFMTELETLGVNVDAVLERMKPKRVASDEKLPVGLRPVERQMVLELSGLSGEMRAQVGQTPEKKRTVALTLKEVTELEYLVSAAVKNCGDKKLAGKWEAIDRILTAVQIHHTDGTEPADALPALLSGQKMSKGAVARDLLLKVLDERRRWAQSS